MKLGFPAVKQGEMLHQRSQETRRHSSYELYASSAWPLCNASTRSHRNTSNKSNGIKAIDEARQAGRPEGKRTSNSASLKYHAAKRGLWAPRISSALAIGYPSNAMMTLKRSRRAVCVKDEVHAQTKWRDAEETGRGKRVARRARTGLVIEEASDADGQRCTNSGALHELCVSVLHADDFASTRGTDSGGTNTSVADGSALHSSADGDFVRQRWWLYLLHEEEQPAQRQVIGACRLVALARVALAFAAAPTISLIDRIAIATQASTAARPERDPEKNRPGARQLDRLSAPAPLCPKRGRAGLLAPVRC
eukprot:6184663-Pleurochrysis_carterae.AAC.2